VLDLEHYLDVLERKPGALAGSKPLEQWRQGGRWPTSYDRLWHALMERQGRQLGTKTMIELLQLGREHGFARLRVAIEAALDLGCTDAAAVQHLLAAESLEHQRPAPLVDLGVLGRTNGHCRRWTTTITCSSSPAAPDECAIRGEHHVAPERHQAAVRRAASADRC
jgi:hypothetical protein